MRKIDICNLMKLDDLGSYDTALPQDWLDASSLRIAQLTTIDKDKAYRTILAGTVWFYPKLPGYAIGYPFPLTTESAELLQILELK